MFPWATREYCLWSMTWGQLILYYNRGMDIKYPKGEDDPGAVLPASKMTHEQLSTVLAEHTKNYGDVTDG